MHKCIPWLSRGSREVLGPLRERETSERACPGNRRGQRKPLAPAVAVPQENVCASVQGECDQPCLAPPPLSLDTHREAAAEGVGRRDPPPRWGLSPSPPAGPEGSGVPGSGGCGVRVSQPRDPAPTPKLALRRLVSP